MNLRVLPVLLALLVWAGLLSGCTPPAPTATTAASGPLPPQVTAEPVPLATGSAVDENMPAVVAARKTLAEKLGVNSLQVNVLQAKQVEWPDSCLGAAGRDEICLTVITPGYLVTLQVNNQVYRVHTNLAGTSVRIAR